MIIQITNKQNLYKQNMLHEIKTQGEIKNSCY